MKNLYFFGGSFFKIKVAGMLIFWWIKYLAKVLSYLKNWGMRDNYCWNYVPSKLLLYFIEYRLDQLNKKRTKIAVNSTIQYFEGNSQKICLLKVWIFGPPTTPTNFCEIERKPSFNGQYFRTWRISKYQNIKMSATLVLKKEPPKKYKFFIFLKGRYFVMGGPLNMNVGVFWETSVGFLKSMVLQLFPKYSQSYVNLNVKSRAKFNCL